MFNQMFTRRRAGRCLLCLLLSLLMAASLLTVAAAEEAPGDSWIGDGAPDSCDVCIVGMLDKPGYFTMAGLRALGEDLVQTNEYGWLNSSGSRDRDTFTGVYIEDLLQLMEISDMAAGIIVTASDDFSRSFFLNDSVSGAYWTDIDGNQMMLAFSGTTSRTDRNIIDFELPRLVVGQSNPDDVNRSGWVSDIVEIRVTAFGDLQGFIWAAPAIEALAINEITDGVGHNRYDPAANLTRSMFVTFLGRALNPEAATPELDARQFTDVDYDSWYGMHVEWAANNGIVQGYGGGRFGPDDNLMLAHMLLMAERVGLEEVPDGIDAEAQRPATRAEAAVVLYALMQMTAEAAG